MGSREPGGWGGRDGLTIRAQRAHFTHTSSKPMGFAPVAGEKREGGKSFEFDFIWQPETPSHSLHQKKGEKHGACTATKSIQTQRARRQR